jgi:predicted DNA-binding transcriptional regulator AlpA
MPNHPGVTGRKSGGQTNPAIDDPIFTEPEMAKRLRISAVTLRRMRKRGEIAFVQLTSNRVGYRQSHGDALLASRTVEAR